LIESWKQFDVAMGSHKAFHREPNTWPLEAGGRADIEVRSFGIQGQGGGIGQPAGFCARFTDVWLIHALINVIQTGLFSAIVIAFVVDSCPYSVAAHAVQGE
jgi:hypothetical protein